MVKKHGIYIKKKTLPYETNRANERRSGTTRNRTGDTRIFSPLLYQLSYGTIILAFCECKDRRFLSISQIFEQFSCQKCTRFRILLYLCTRKSGFSAVGSALRSGRRGRWFESSNPDSKRWKGNDFPPLFSLSAHRNTAINDTQTCLTSTENARYAGRYATTGVTH